MKNKTTDHLQSNVNGQQKVSSNIKNERSLYWNLILYPNEDISHKNALDFIVNNYSYAYIIHNNDINEDGTIKKEHCHVVIRFNNYRWRNAIAEELNITSNYLERCRNLSSSLRYLIHFDDGDKYQYDIKEVHGDLRLKLEKLIEDKNVSESEKVIFLLNFLKEYDKDISLTEFIEFCCTKNLYSVYRRNAYSFNKILEEHNFNIYKKNRYKY